MTFKEGDVVRRKLDEQDIFWVDSARDKNLNPNGVFVVIKAANKNLYLEGFFFGWVAERFEYALDTSVELDDYL